MSTHLQKIMIFDTFSRTGGGLSYVKNVTEYLIKKGIRNYRYIFVLNPAIKKEIENCSKDVEIHYVDKRFEKGGAHGFFGRKHELYRAKKKYSPDIIICMNQVELKIKDIPVVLFLRNALYFVDFGEQIIRNQSIRQRFRLWYLYKKSLQSIKNSSICMTATKSFQEQIIKKVAINKKWIVAPFGYNEKTKSKCRRDYSKKYKILTLQYNFYKGIENAVKVVSLLNGKGYNCKLTITDSVSNIALRKNKQLMKLISKPEVFVSVDFIGKISHDELSKVYAEHDIFIFPSVIESFGHGLLEAMGNGLPCVVSDILIHREVCGDGVLYAVAGDFHDFFNKVEMLLNDEVMRNEIGEKGKKRVERFTWEKHVSILECAADELLKTRKMISEKNMSKIVKNTYKMKKVKVQRKSI